MVLSVVSKVVRPSEYSPVFDIAITTRWLSIFQLREFFIATSFLRAGTYDLSSKCRRIAIEVRKRDLAHR
jgi:hypothetical protein